MLALLIVLNLMLCLLKTETFWFSLINLYLSWTFFLTLMLLYKCILCEDYFARFIYVDVFCENLNSCEKLWFQIFLVDVKFYQISNNEGGYETYPFDKWMRTQSMMIKILEYFFKNACIWLVNYRWCWHKSNRYSSQSKPSLHNISSFCPYIYIYLKMSV